MDVEAIPEAVGVAEAIVPDLIPWRMRQAGDSLTEEQAQAVVEAVRAELDRFADRLVEEVPAAEDPREELNHLVDRGIDAVEEAALLAALDAGIASQG